MSVPFKISIEAQHWLGSDDACYGTIRAAIDGAVVSDADSDEYGVAQSALQLLRTLDADHEAGGRSSAGNRSRDTANTCTVRRDGDEVVLDHVVHYGQSERRFDVTARLPVADYRRAVAAFAQEAREFYFADGPRQVDEPERPLHEQSKSPTWNWLETRPTVPLTLSPCLSLLAGVRRTSSCLERRLSRLGGKASG